MLEPALQSLSTPIISIRDPHFPSYAEFEEPQLRQMWEEQLADIKAFMPYIYTYRHVSLHVCNLYGQSFSYAPLYLISCILSNMLTIAPLTFLARMNYCANP
jgi:hypothetical protein